MTFAPQMTKAQRTAALRQILTAPIARQALFEVLRSHREVAIQGVLTNTDPALIHRAQGRVHAIDSIIEEYTECLSP